ncbi:unnamed protein product [Trichobilharzia regenti]|nr:unnamed protein product [Trichobilharzia regenti]
MADLDCSTNLKCIVQRLPRHLRWKWAELVNDGLQFAEPSFRYLKEFLERQLSLATSCYGQIADGNRNNNEIPMPFLGSGNECKEATSIFCLEESESVEHKPLRMIEAEFQDKHSCETSSSEIDKEVLKATDMEIRLRNGHYEVPLTWKEDWSRLPPNRFGAERRLDSLQKKLKKDESLLKSYNQILTDHELKGYISRVPDDFSKKCRFIPHHPVINPRKPGKIRVDTKIGALIPVYDDSSQLNVLTPNHILLSRNPEQVPEIDVSLCGRYSRRWKQGQLLADTFWRRWKREYLTTLQSREKWVKRRRNLQVGDLVLVTAEPSPRNLWLMGIITGVTASCDGYIRKMDIKTPRGIVNRDVRKVCLLEGIEER